MTAPTAPPGASPGPPPVPPQPLASKPFGPAVFITGAALTAVGTGLIVWSGIDTVNNPGQTAVRKACINGYDAACKSVYDPGSAAEVRTNVFVAVTSVLGVATGVVGLFFTQWSSPATVAGAQPAPARTLSVVPVLGIGQAGLAGAF